MDEGQIYLRGGGGGGGGGAILVVGQIYLWGGGPTPPPPPSTNETKIALRTGKPSILMSHNLMKKYGTVNSLGLV